MQIKTDGIVLREVQTSEADTIVTILTRDRGIISGFVGNARKLRSRKAAATSVLCYSRFELYERQSLYIVDGAEAIEMFMGLRQDVIKLSLAAYFAELSRCLVPEGDRTEGFLRLVLNSLHLLSEEKRPMMLIKAVFELRMLELAGHMPDLVACEGCGAYEGPLSLLAHRAVLLCDSCKQTDDMRGEIPIPLAQGVLAAMRHIIYSEERKIFDFSLSDEGLEALAKAVQIYLTVQLDRGFSTLDFFHSMRKGAV